MERPLPADTAPSRGVGLVCSLNHHPLWPDHRKTWQRCPHKRARLAPAAALRVDGEETQSGRRKGVRRSRAALRRWWDAPSLADHPHPSLAWLSQRGEQKKRGEGRAGKSPESERTGAPGGSSGCTAHLHRHLHTCGRPGETTRLHLHAWSIGDHLTTSPAPLPDLPSCHPPLPVRPLPSTEHSKHTELDGSRQVKRRAR